MEKERISDEIDDLIVTYLAEGLEAGRSERLREWIAASPENQQYFRQMQEIWMASMDENRLRQFNKEEAYKRFLVHTAARKTTAVRKKRSPFLQPFLYGAAAVILLLLVSYVSYWQGEKRLKNQFADIAVEAPLGSRTKVYLPDSTLVWLNAGSKISYSQGFGVNERQLQLSGEGYFEVTRNVHLPFEVRTKELQVKVLGTKFNFKNYPEDEEASVSLLEGKVLVNNTVKKNDRVNLVPDQKVFLNKKTGAMRLLKVNAQYSAEWTNGFLFFDEELLPDIIKKLERSYNVKISLADQSLQTFRFYGNFIRKENTIQEILEMLASTDKLKYKIRGKNIELSSTSKREGPH